MNNFKNSKYQLIFFLIMIVIIFALYLQNYSTEKELDDMRRAIQDHYAYHFAIDVGDVETYFGQQFIEGASKKAEDLNVLIEIKGVNSPYSSEEVDFVTWCCMANVDAVVSAGYHTVNQNSISEEGILSEAQTYCALFRFPTKQAPLDYIGVENGAIGIEIANELELLSNEKLQKVILMYSGEEKNCEDTAYGRFIESVKACQNITVIDEIEIHADVLEAMGKAEEALLLYPEIDQIICFDETILQGAARAIVDLNRVGSVKAAGRGYSVEIANYVKKEIVSFAIDEHPYELGMHCIDQLYQAKKGEISKNNMYTELTVHKG